jgi:transcriptional regulator with XRE-family HTH domain
MGRTGSSQRMTSAGLTPSVGDCIREWRQRRRMSQLDLACEAEISARHLSFLETGRAVPSREMVLRLAERLEVPVRERNILLLAAGYAPMFSQHPFDAPELTAARAAIWHWKARSPIRRLQSIAVGGSLLPMAPYRRSMRA